MKKIAALLVLSSVCCAVFEILCFAKYDPDGLAALFNKITDVSTYVKLLVWNTPIISGQLWYLLAALYVYALFYFTTKYRIKENVIFTVSFFLLALQLLLGEGLSAFGIVLSTPYVRNFALMGIPFFALGLFVKKYEYKFRSVPLPVILIFAIVGIFASLFSRFTFGENELHVGSLFVLAAFVCVFIQYADVKYPAFLLALEGCSTYVYVFHIMISTFLCILYGMFGINIYSSVTLENLHPVVVCIASTIFAFLFIKIQKAIRKNKT